MSIESVMPSNHLILCRPFLPPSIFPSIRVISNESVLHIRWPKYWSFSFSTSPSSEYSELISFRIDWLDLLRPIFQCIISFDKMYTIIGSITRNQKPPAAATTEHKTWCVRSAPKCFIFFLVLNVTVCVTVYLISLSNYS